jgi:hypothetical protein
MQADNEGFSAGGANKMGFDGLSKSADLSSRTQEHLRTVYALLAGLLALAGVGVYAQVCIYLCVYLRGI